MYRSGHRPGQTVLAGLFGVSLAIGAASSTNAQGVAEFYKDKTIAMVIGIPPGGGYDIYARLLARHLPKHIPGQPDILPQNLPGGGELNAANYIVNVAPQDGTAMGAVVRTVPFLPLYGNTAAKFDPQTIHWLGSSNQDVGLFVVWRDGVDRTLADLNQRELIVGTNPPGSDTHTIGNLLKNLFGLKLKLVGGYPGSEDIVLAMQRGEVQAISNYSWSNLQRRADLLKEKKVQVLLQNGLKKLPDWPDVPLILELARSDEERAILELMLGQTTYGRPYFVAPKVPADRVAALRVAFMATMRDQDFLENAKKQKLEIDPISGEDMQQAIARIYKTPAAVIEKANAIRK